MEARLAHNQEVIGSNPIPAIASHGLNDNSIVPG